MIPTRVWMPNESIPAIPPGRYNFGERLGTWILEQIGMKPLLWHEMERRDLRKVREVLIPLGSVIGHDMGLPDKVIRHYWGCGISGRISTASMKRRRMVLHGVRGPISRDILGLSRDTVIGDTGLLAGEFFKGNAAGDGGILWTSHLSTKSIIPDRFLDSLGVDRVLDLDIGYGDIEDSLAAIRSADMVCGTALHPMVAAASLGTPFAFVAPKGFIPEFPTKYFDFCASIGIPFVLCHSLAEAQAFWREWGPRIVLPEARRLLDVLPFKP